MLKGSERPMDLPDVTGDSPEAPDLMALPGTPQEMTSELFPRLLSRPVSGAAHAGPAFSSLSGDTVCSTPNLREPSLSSGGTMAMIAATSLRVARQNSFEMGVWLQLHRRKDMQLTGSPRCPACRVAAVLTSRPYMYSFLSAFGEDSKERLRRVEARERQRVLTS